MHPRIFLDSFWRNDLRDEVFVVMQFGAPYDERFERIFKPAIEGDALAGMSLRAGRADTRLTGDCILTEIDDGIGHSQLILADVSVVHRCKVGGTDHVLRNGNAMYEVGLALACRQPVEVILVRDDDEKLLFDVSNIPVTTYDPLDVAGSVLKIRGVLVDRLRERDLVRDHRAISALESLSPFELDMIKSNAHITHMGWPFGSLPASVAMALPQLLGKRIMRREESRSAEFPHAYTWTTFGRAIADRVRPPSTP